jgi:quinoprotein glucose dehydrogenase
MLFVPTGSAAFDFFGGNRKGNNLYANCLLALDARTGKRLWHFQAVHHDILDRDFPSPPNLLTLERDGKKVDVVAQISKQGFVYVFERETGKPFFDIKEQPVPASELADEWSPKTQPIPVKPVPYARQLLKDSNDISPYASNRKELIEKLKKVRSEGPFTPLSSRGTIIYPGLDGGGEWGGAAVDPEGVMYVNSNEMAWLISLSKQEPEKKSGDGGSRLYTQYCVVCHGENRKGNAASGYPDLTSVAKKFQRAQVQTLISKGKGMMPAFKQLNANQQKAIVAYLYGDKPVVVAKEPGQNASTMKYKISGYSKFLDKDGYPGIAPPWGTLNAIDLNTGEYVWKISYGEYPELMARGIPATGAESYGGPAVTAGGLLFIAGTKDEKFRAYDKKTGQLLWETKLPAAAFATPSVYEVNGRQYVVVACGGTKLGAKKGESYVAFALPR